jgi:hypothetical protein
VIAKLGVGLVEIALIDNFAPPPGELPFANR